MKTAAGPTNLSQPLARRDLVAILGYVNRGSRKAKCVDGSFGGAEVHLDRLAAAARMQ
jgi:hypothetical protein